MIYIGEYTRLLDNKNRLFIPSQLRKNSKSFIITCGLDVCLYLYTPSQWEKIVSKFDKISLKDKSQERAFKRIFLAKANLAKVDFQGRIVIPQNLAQEVCLGSHVVIAGVQNRIEIWNKKRWVAYSKKAKKIFVRLKEKLEI